MGFDFTDNQKKAINENGNILVSAAAGSGKTAVLAERVVKRLTDDINPVSIDRMLIVTFTEAAAAEMKSRIEEKLNAKCEENPQNSDWLKQKHLLACSDICTIDSFCINFLRENFHLLNVEPDFEVGDDSVYAEEIALIFRDMITKRLNSGDKDFKQLLEYLDCEKSVKPFSELVESIYSKSLNQPFPDEFLDNFTAAFTDNFDDNSVYCKELMRLAAVECAKLNVYSKRLSDDALLIDKENGHIEYSKRFADETAYLTAAFLSGSYDEIYKAVFVYKNFRASGNPSKPKKDDTAIPFAADIEAIKRAENALFKCIAYDRDTVRKHNAMLLPLAKQTVEFVREYTDRIYELYREKNFMSFATAEQAVFSLLCKKEDGKIVLSPSAYDYLSRYDEVLVDEFQDVNDLQDKLFYVLSNHEKNLFAVGDIKQSIYRFRGSNPKNFADKKAKYIPLEDAKDGDAKKIILSDNFRSRKGVCDFVNYFFSLIMNTGVGDVCYDGEERLNCGAKFTDTDYNSVELIFADKAEVAEDNTSDDNGDMKNAEYEAECIASRIVSLMNSDFTVKNEEKKDMNVDDGVPSVRPPRYSDFAVLLPAVKNKSDIIVKTFKRHGIPVSLAGESFIEKFEISVMLSLLKLIDNPFCDIDAVNVLLSPIYNFSADEIAEIRADFKVESVYGALSRAAESGNEKAIGFIKSISGFRRDGMILPLPRFVNKLMLETGHLNFVSAMEEGNERRENLLKLIGFAESYSGNGGKMLSGFVKYMNELPSAAFENKGVPSGDTVRVMTIHRSKGLQFPVCFVAGISAQLNHSDWTGKVLFNSKYGMGIKCYDYDNDVEIVSASHTVISNYEREATIEEKIRLLYVAFTRAEEKLVIVTSFNKLYDKVNELNACAFNDDGELDKAWFSKATVLSHWVIAACLKDKNCKQIREMAANPVISCDSNSGYDVGIVGGIDAVKSNEAPEENTDINKELAEKLRDNISYVYPYEQLGTVRAKSSVSAMAEKKSNERFYFTEKPEFMLSDGISASGRGTAVHRIMQFIEFSEKPDVVSELERLVEWQFISPQQKKAADVGQLERFFESNVYKRISASKDVRREMRFLSEIPAEKLNPDIADDLKATPVVIQGAVDLCFVEDDGVVVVDFKTDRVDDKEQLLTLYGEQLKIYSDACEKIFELPVKERIIYSFTLSKEISL